MCQGATAAIVRLAVGRPLAVGSLAVGSLLTTESIRPFAASAGHETGRRTDPEASGWRPRLASNHPQATPTPCPFDRRKMKKHRARDGFVIFFTNFSTVSIAWFLSTFDAAASGSPTAPAAIVPRGIGRNDHAGFSVSPVYRLSPSGPFPTIPARRPHGWGSRPSCRRRSARCRGTCESR